MDMLLFLDGKNTLFVLQRSVLISSMCDKRPYFLCVCQPYFFSRLRDALLAPCQPMMNGSRAAPSAVDLL
jgi:hypothetical protein